MGVIKQPRKVFIQTGDSHSEASTAPPTDDESGRSTPVVLDRNPVPICPALVSRNIGYRLKLKKGRRSQQRFENERLLMAMYGIESQDCEVGADISKETNSYFTDLMDDENKGILEEFLNNEESKYFNIHEEEEEGEGDDTVDRDEFEKSFQAEEAFLRIGFRMRQALRRNVPIGMLRGIEETLNENFAKDPQSEFTCEMSSFERLLVHALSAYNCLNSYSLDRDGKRIVKVENPRKQFFKKDPTLTEYLILRNNL